MITITHESNEDLFKKLENGSVDVIVTDPPYKYLKNQKLEVDFDETEFFSQVNRVLKKEGFVVLFGRGTSFYRWNYMLSELGFEFKEEIIWDKSHGTSPLMALSRVHETVSIYCKGKSKINKVKIPYLEMKSHDTDSIIQDVKRMRTILKNTKSLDAVLSYLENNNHNYKNTETFSKSGVTTDNKSAGCTDRAAEVVASIQNGMNEKSIIRYRDTSDSCQANNLSISSKITKEDRSVSVVRSIDEGMNEKSIIKQVRDHYTSIHPTQKPVRLLERLINLVAKPNALILDPFGGSFSTMEACFNLGYDGISCELDKEYFDKGADRIYSLIRMPKPVHFDEWNENLDF